MRGASIYAYKHDFFQHDKKAKRPFLKKTRLRLIHLIMDGYIEYGKHDEDKFMAIAQYLMGKGYSLPFIYSGCVSQIQKFFQDTLFTINPFHFELCGRNNFSLVDYRNQFDYDNKILLELSPFYRNRGAMPLERGVSTATIKRLLFDGIGRMENINELRYSFNQSHPTAVWIRERTMDVRTNYFIYKIKYGFIEDKNERCCSSWEITIRSEDNENYIDFIWFLYSNYERIISGDKELLISQYSNNYKLKRDV